MTNRAQERQALRRIKRGFKVTPDILKWNSIPFSMVELSYDSHGSPLLLLISSLFPGDGWSKRSKIKGKRAVLPLDAEKSRPRTVASFDVQILLKSTSPCPVPLQFPYVFKFADEVSQKKA